MKFKKNIKKWNIKIIIIIIEEVCFKNLSQILCNKIQNFYKRFNLLQNKQKK